MAQRNMKVRAWQEGEVTNVRALIFHPMETGQRKDKGTGKRIPAHFIREVVCTHGSRQVLTCLWGSGISQNPFLSFRFRGAKAGDTLKLSWTDNLGEHQSAEVKIG